MTVGGSKERSAIRRVFARRRLWLIVCAAIAIPLACAATATARERILKPASYPGLTTYTCSTDSIPIHPGQNMNLAMQTKTCPNARKVSGPGNASPFAPGSTAQGFVTRFEPSMVEVKQSGKLVTPSVWDLHLHHVVWLAPDGGPTFAVGEEKTIAAMPKGYGLRVGGDANWFLNYMIHSLNASEGREVRVTWEIDWVPETSPAAAHIDPVYIQWLDVAGAPRVYPVFDAERGFDLDDNGRYVFPDEVPADPSQPGFEERSKISDSHTWKLQRDTTLVFGAGHLHPGGLNVDLEVARDGADPGSIDGDDPSEIRKLFRSRARYYEPAGAVSWDVTMTATPRNWRIALKAGDTVSIDVTYDVRKASWYESMGILPLAVSEVADPKAKDPFENAGAVRAMYEAGPVLTHGRLRENIDAPAGDDLGLPDPRDLDSSGPVPEGGVEISSFLSSPGGFSALRGFPTGRMSPPVIQPGESVTFTSQDALPGEPDTSQAWHTITSCKAPCNRGAGIGYPLAGGPVKFDSGELGFGSFLSEGVTEGTNTYTTPPLTDPGTYSYFCRIHPFMRGSIRVQG